MQAVAPPLEDLRAEIDRIDEAMLELLIERSDVVRRIGDLKDDRRNDRLALRPAREARILRRLLSMAAGRFPAAALVRMWRELLAAQTRLQTPLSVSVFTPRGGFRTWDLARDHFGSNTPMTRVDSPSQAIRAVGDHGATVAVLPMPGDEEPWWPALISDQHDRLRVFARLPFVLCGPGEREEPGAVAIGRIEPEASGDDMSLLAIEAEAGISRGRLKDLMAAAGLAPVWVAAFRPPREPQALHLVEVGGLVQDGDDRIAQIRNAARSEVLRIVPVGGYARPLEPPAAPLFG